MSEQTQMEHTGLTFMFLEAISQSTGEALGDEDRRRFVQLCRRRLAERHARETYRNPKLAQIAMEEMWNRFARNTGEPSEQYGKSPPTEEPST